MSMLAADSRQFGKLLKNGTIQKVKHTFSRNSKASNFNEQSLKGDSESKHRNEMVHVRSAPREHPHF